MPSGVFQSSADKSPPGAERAAASRQARSASDSAGSEAEVIGRARFAEATIIRRPAPTSSSSPRSTPNFPPTPSFRPGTAPNSGRLHAKRTSRPKACATHSRAIEESGRENSDMSGKGFHVHGPHEHELEHAAQAEPH